MLINAIRWMDASIVNPVAARLAGSVANPAVLSFLLWDRVKTLTPQRARDLMRLLTTAMTDALGVFGAEKGQQLRASSKQLQKDFLCAAVSRNGRDVVLNSVATVAKVAQALNTPETKSATQQLVHTVQSVVDFFASDEGRRVIETMGECVTRVTDMAASPEASIFLAELATNLLHSLESEEIRKQQETVSKDDGKTNKQGAQEYRDVENELERQREMEMNGETTGKRLDSSTSSATDARCSLDAESRSSSAPGTTRRQSLLASPAERNSSYRSARIEKEVLISMGVDPSMLGEIQRALDTIAAKEEEEERATMQRRREEAEYVAGLVRPHSVTTTKEARTDEVVDKDNGGENVPPSVLIPEWHEEPFRKALHRRHAHAEKVAEQRDPFDHQARKMAAVLVQRNANRGNLQPGDIVACRFIARVIIYGVGVFVLLMGYLFGRHFFG
uniref:Uncharacterized protein n=1 Tax=Peronospora matthiolae TaxID=2874970 RepID=A0AAV1VB24_9STRA